MNRPDWTRRRVRWAPQLDEQRLGTILAFPGSRVTALRTPDGWVVYGRRTDGSRELDRGSLERNLPAVVVRRGKWGRRAEA